MLRILITIVIALLLAIYGTAYALNTQAPYEAPEQVFEAEPVQDTTPTQKPVTKAEKPSDEPIWVENPQDCDLHTQWVYADGSCRDKAVEQVVSSEPKPAPARSEATPQSGDCVTEIAKYDWDYDTAVAVAVAESGLNPTALNNNPATGDYSVGCFQINIYGANAYSRPSEAELYNPVINVEFAYRIYVANGHSFIGQWGVCRKIACY